MKTSSVIMMQLALLAVLLPDHAFASSWGVVIDHWEQYNATDDRLKKAQEKAKKKSEKAEKDFKKSIDKLFKENFEAVLGDKIKPSEAFDLLKIIEGAAAGDIEYAGKQSTDFLIAKYTPLLGSYITVLKKSAEGIKLAEKVWIAELYYTDAASNALTLITEAKREYPPYIPSYMITYLRNNKALGKEIQKIYGKMIARELKMFTDWQGKDQAHINAVEELLYEGTDNALIKNTWDARLRAKLGYTPSERKIFNHFLYYYTSNHKQQYLESFQYEYIEPMLKREARKQRSLMNKAASDAINQAISQLDHSIEDEKNNAEKEKKQQEEKRKKEQLEKERKPKDANAKTTNAADQQQEKLHWANTCVSKANALTLKIKGYKNNQKKLMKIFEDAKMSQRAAWKQWGVDWDAAMNHLDTLRSDPEANNRYVSSTLEPLQVKGKRFQKSSYTEQKLTGVTSCKKMISIVKGTMLVTDFGLNLSESQGYCNTMERLGGEYRVGISEVKTLACFTDKGKLKPEIFAIRKQAGLK